MSDLSSLYRKAKRGEATPAELDTLDAHEARKKPPAPATPDPKVQTLKKSTKKSPDAQ